MCVGGDHFGNTYLIFHHRITKVFDQTSKFVRILDIVDKALGLSFVDQWLKFSENVFQFPDKSFVLDSTLDLGGCELTIPILPSLIAPSRRLQGRVYRVR